MALFSPFAFLSHKTYRQYFILKHQHLQADYLHCNTRYINTTLTKCSSDFLTTLPTPCLQLHHSSGDSGHLLGKITRPESYRMEAYGDYTSYMTALSPTAQEGTATHHMQNHILSPEEGAREPSRSHSKTSPAELL